MTKTFKARPTPPKKIQAGLGAISPPKEAVNYPAPAWGALVARSSSGKIVSSWGVGTPISRRSPIGGSFGKNWRPTRKEPQLEARLERNFNKIVSPSGNTSAYTLAENFVFQMSLPDT